jgi:hypothetical protein
MQEISSHRIPTIAEQPQRSTSFTLDITTCESQRYTSRIDKEIEDTNPQSMLDKLMPPNLAKQAAEV